MLCSFRPLICAILVLSVLIVMSASPPANAAETDSGLETEEGALTEPSPEKHELEEIYVRGKPWRNLLEEPKLESPGLETSTSVVDLETIEEQNAYSLIEGMSYVPGGWVEDRGRKVKQFFSVRGQKYLIQFTP